MSMTGTERRLLKKARRLKTEIEMLTASRDLRIERETEKTAARRAEQLRQEGLRAAEESFESLGADEIRRAITEKRLREENERYDALRKEILLCGYLLSDEENEALASAHESHLERIREKTAAELSSLSNPSAGKKLELPAVAEEGAAPDTTKLRESCDRKIENAKERLRNVERRLESSGASNRQAELEEGIILRIQDLKMYFGGVKAVDGLSFDVHEGEIFGLIGPNGAGKTTVFNCITQFYKPTGGTLLFRGRENEVVDLTKEKVHDVILHGIVRTFQNVEVVPELTVLENLLIAGHRQYSSGIAASALHLPKLRREEDVIRYKAEKVLSFMGLSAYAGAYAFGLPYGILKKIEIARTLMCSPRLIILDEPAAGLNDTETADLARLIRRIREEYRCTILLVEHDMGLVMDVCDNICAISFGKLLAFGTPEQIQTNRDVQQAYLGVDEEGESDGTA
jgi:branched-chain amino acid transport system ATP-binding protein